MEDDFQFEWGKKGGVGDEGGAHSQYYESFTLNGKEYSLYDCVHFYKTGETETDIGKLVKIYETEAHVKMIRVIWFFRPNEIRNFLGVYEPRWNEIFLGSGQGVGLSNVNHLEAIIGKCTVVCTLKDPKNPQPSEAELQRASYIYSRTFDVGKCKLLEKFPNEIQGVPVECFFNKSVECFGNNRNDDQKPLRLPDFRKNLGGPVGQSNVSSKLGSKKNMASPANNAKSSSRMNPVVRELKKPTVCAGLRGNASKGILKHKLVLDGNGIQSTSITHGHFKEKRKVQFVDQPPMTASAIPHKKKKVPDGVAFTKQETSEKTPDDRSHWFKNKMELTWEQKLRSAQETGHLVLLENLDPSYASSDVEGLVSQALNQKVEAKMIQQNAFSAPHHGKAFVVFESKVAADKAISDLERKCLVLDDQRCVIGSRKTLKAPDRAPRFVGHLSISKIRHQNQHEDMRKAVSTSHSAQPNTFEYDLAMGWRLQELRSNRYWEALYKEQVEEINQVRRAKSEL